MSKHFARLLKPSAHWPWWLDAIGLLIFGTWFLTPILAAESAHTSIFLPVHPNPHNYSCGGPGFADYGCAGGTEAVVSNIIGTIFMLMLLGICAVIVARLVDRVKRS